MPYRSDPTLWFNLPGVIAAYQPVNAPAYTVSMWNQANGGISRFRLQHDLDVPWTQKRGWLFNGLRYMRTFINPTFDQVWSIFVRFSGTKTNYGNWLLGYVHNSSPYDGVGLVSYNWGSSYVAQNGGIVSSTPHVTSGVLGFAGDQGIYNGVSFGSIAPATQTITANPELYVGAVQQFGSPAPWGFAASDILAVAIYRRKLSLSDAWSVSRQMAYCDQNPDWSAWGQRRRYYHSPPEVTATAVALYYHQRQQQGLS